MKEKQLAKSIYKTIDMLHGIISEQGWESLDRYSETSFDNYKGLLTTLKFLDIKKYKVAIKEAKLYGMIQ